MAMTRNWTDARVGKWVVIGRAPDDPNRRRPHRRTRLIGIDGKRLCVADAAISIGVNRSTLRGRLRRANTDISRHVAQHTKLTVEQSLRFEPDSFAES